MNALCTLRGANLFLFCFLPITPFINHDIILSWILFFIGLKTLFYDLWMILFWIFCFSVSGYTCYFSNLDWFILYVFFVSFPPLFFFSIFYKSLISEDGVKEGQANGLSCPFLSTSALQLLSFYLKVCFHTYTALLKIYVFKWIK